MNQQNQTLDPNPQKPFQRIHTISEQDFYNWTLEWYQQIASTDSPLDVFTNDFGVLMKKIYFNDETIQNLLSSIGVENIHARFAIIDKYKYYGIRKKTFTIILYATDNQGKRRSAYHIGLPQYHYDLLMEEGNSKVNEPHYICDILAQKWISGWHNVYGPADPKFPKELFLTDYGFLNGYNYSMSDFMYALYPPGGNVKNYDIIILLAIHKHAAHRVGEGIQPDHEDTQPMLSTFGLVVAGVEIVGFDPDNKAEKVNSYYDLSLPCPPNQ